MFSLTHKTEQWVAHKIITPDQAAAVLAYEQKQPSSVTPLMFYIFIGVFTIACGVVALISSNWMEIPDEAKIAGLFVFLAGYAAGLCSIKKTKPKIFEAGLFLYMLLFFGAIGLIGQVFHLKSDTYKAFLFWSGLTFPLLFLSRKTVMGFVWLPVFFVSASCSPWVSNLYEFLFRSFYFSFHPLISFMFLTGYVGAGFLTKYPKYSVFSSPLRFYTAVGLVLPFLTFFSPYWWWRSSDADAGTSIQIAFLLYSLLFGTLIWKTDDLDIAVKKTLGALTVFYLLVIFIPVPVPFLNFIFRLVLLFGLSVFAFQIKNSRLFNWITAGIVIYILITFFRLFGSLMYTGLGLIASGVLILCACVGWYKLKQVLRIKMEKRVSS